MRELLLLLLITVYAWAIGLPVLRCFSLAFATRAGRLSAATALGLGIIAYLIFGLGLMGSLNLYAVLTTALLFIGLVWLLHGEKGSGTFCLKGPEVAPHKRFLTPFPTLFEKKDPRTLLLRDKGAERESSPDSSLPRKFAHCLLGIACIGTLIGALAPPTAGDALCYHLEIPKRFVQLGAVRYLPLTDNSLFPFLMEMLYTLGLLLSGPVLAQLMHWLVGLLLALAVVELAEPLVGKSGSAWAGTITLLVPGITNQMTAPLNDLATALYCTLMVTAWMNWSRTAQWRWLLLAGVFGGLATSAKLVAAGMVVVVAATLAFEQCRRGGFKQALVGVTVFLACVCLCGGIWYLRSWYHLGNPVYPYFGSLFRGEPHARSVLRTSYSLWELPWAATMHPEAFGGRGHQYGAIFLALLPGLCLVRRPPGLARLLIPVLGFGLIWFALRQDLRFALSTVPAMAVAVVAVIQGLGQVHRPAWVAAVAALAGLLAFQSLIVLKRAVPRTAVATGLQSREAYLERNEPSYEVARFVNSRLAPDARLISQDYRGLYFEQEFVREAVLRRRFAYPQRGEQLVHYLTTSGFTHVLLVQAYNTQTARYDQSFTERLGAARERLPVVLRAHYEGPDGDRRDYQLLALPRRDHLRTN